MIYMTLDGAFEALVKGRPATAGLEFLLKEGRSAAIK